MGGESSKESKSRAGRKAYVIGKTPSIEKHYILKDRIGQPGQYGYAQVCVPRTKKSKKTTPETRAVKVISKSRFMPSHYKHFRREIEIMKDLDHPNVIKGFEAFEDDQKVYLVMELCQGGELFDRIQQKSRYSEKDAAAVLRQLLEGIAYLHKNKIAHCDLKPSNFLFKTKAEDSTVKIIDFGMSKHTKPREYMDMLCGTSFYIAPEVLRGKYTYHCDMWSLGVVLFIMIFGFPPFHGKEDHEVHGKIRAGFLPEVRPGYGAWFPESMLVSSGVKDFIAKLLDSDPAVRLTAAEALEHPWLQNAPPTELTNVISNLTAFTANCRFKAKVLSAMSQSLSNTDLDQLRRSFEAVDLNGDGSITIDEIKKAMQSSGDKKFAQGLETLIKMADVDGDGALDYNELVMAAVQKKLLAKEERLYNTFSQLDRNGDGFITPDEIVSVLGEQSDLAQMIQEVDKNGDGKVDYNEFCTMFVQSQSPPVLETAKSKMSGAHASTN